MRTQHSLSRLLSLASLLLAATQVSCAAVDDVDPTDDGADEVRTTGSQYLRLRRDTRRCVSPLCGGYWASRVNQPTTRCADGAWQAECYVAGADFTALGLDATALDTFLGAALSGRAVVRARIEAKTFGTFGSMGQLVALEGFQAATEAAATGSFQLAHGPARTCVRAPCFRWDADKLNGVTTTPVSEVRLDRVAGITGASLRAARAQLDAAEGVVVAGRFEATAGGGRALVASQVFLRVSPGVADTAYCNVDDECTVVTRGRDVTSRDDCYCALCPSTVLNTATAARYDRNYSRYCTAAFRATCPVARCIRPPTVACVNHACAVVTP